MGIDRSKETKKLMEYLQLEQEDKKNTNYDLSILQTMDSEKASGEPILYMLKMEPKVFKNKSFSS